MFNSSWYSKYDSYDDILYDVQEEFTSTLDSLANDARSMIDNLNHPARPYRECNAESLASVINSLEEFAKSIDAIWESLSPIQDELAMLVDLEEGEEE